MIPPSEARLAAFLESTNVGLWEWNIDTGELNINDRWAEMLGYEWSELSPFTFKKWEELLHPQDRKVNLESITSVIENKRSHYDNVVRLRHKTDGWRWIHTRGVLFKESEQGDQWFVGSHSDITDFKQVQHQLGQVAESLPGIIYSFAMKPDGSKNVLYMSRKTEDFYGFLPEVAIRNPDRAFDLVHPDDLEHVNQMVKHSYETLNEFSCDYRVQVGGTTSWMRGMSTPERDSDGTVTWHGLIINIDKQKKLEEELKRLSITDELTGAFNRRYILTELNAQLSTHQRYNHPFSLVSIDIDHFKNTNDTFGHLFGDEVLTRFADIVISRIRKTDSLARMGGEEFLILMPHTLLTDAFTLAEDLRKAVEEQSFEPVEGQVHRITISAGVVECSESGISTVEELLLACDKSLYDAKNAGRNRSVVYNK